MMGVLEVFFETMVLMDEVLIHLLHLCFCWGVASVRKTSGNGQSYAVLVSRKYAGTLSCAVSTVIKRGSFHIGPRSMISVRAESAHPLFQSLGVICSCTTN